MFRGRRPAMVLRTLGTARTVISNWCSPQFDRVSTGEACAEESSLHDFPGFRKLCSFITTHNIYDVKAVNKIA